MANWVLKGLRTGIKSTHYPRRPENAAGVSPGQPRGASFDSAADVEDLVARCPTRAIAPQDGGVAIDHSRCIHCLRCRHDAEGAAVPGDRSYEWASHNPDSTAAVRRVSIPRQSRGL